MNGQLTAEGYLDRLALARVERRGSPPVGSGDTRRAWQLELGLGFDPSALGEYCLSHCHGFLVDTDAGAPVGVVDEVRVDPNTGQAASFEIAAGWSGRRRLVLAVEEVRVILPLERRLVVGRPGSVDAHGSG